MKNDLRALKNVQEKERMDMRLERAMKLTHLDSFDYYTSQNNYDYLGEEDSDDLAESP